MPTDAPKESSVLSNERLRGGQMWSRILRRGQHLKLVDLEGGASVAALFYNADQPLERYNMPDTLKAQHIARLTTDNVLYSDMGHVLCAVVSDTCGWHDTITGHMTASMSERKFGAGSYQKLRNDFHRNTRDNFLTELGKHGLGKRDLAPNLNFFVKVAVEPDGQLRWVANNSKAGAFIELRSEMNTLVILSNTPHPLDPAPTYAPKPVEVVVRAGKPASHHGCRHSCAENERGFELTDRHFD